MNIDVPAPTTNYFFFPPGCGKNVATWFMFAMFLFLAFLEWCVYKGEVPIAATIIVKTKGPPSAATVGQLGCEPSPPFHPLLHQLSSSRFRLDKKEENRWRGCGGGAELSTRGRGALVDILPVIVPFLAGCSGSFICVRYLYPVLLVAVFLRG